MAFSVQPGGLAALADSCAFVCAGLAGGA